MNDLALLPTPRHFELGSGRCTIPAKRSISPVEGLDVVLKQLELSVTATKPWITATVDTKQVPHPEGYDLRIASDGIILRAHDVMGLRWGLMTLRQLIADATRSGDLPCLHISDHPAFAHRGVMLDISRDRVPTMATLFDLVERMAGLKLNHLQLYAEHTVAYPGHEAVSRNADPITLEELKTLGAFAAERGVSLNANQNSLGHWERWLKVPAYAGLGEVSQGIMVNGNWYVDPTTLYPGDPKAMTLVCDLLRQQMAACPGDYVNIGCDEPWELGQGRSKERCEKEGTTKVFSEWVSQVSQYVLKSGKRPQFWCDPHPREDDSLPKDLIALVWGYDARTDFATRAKAHRAAGRAVWVCPGTGCWNSTTGRSDIRHDNLAGARDQGLASGAEGYLCTVWGDNGHRQPWPVTLHGIADAAQASWGHGDFDAAANGHRLFGSAALGRWLHELGQADAVIRSGKGGGFNSDANEVHNSNAFSIDMSRNLQDLSGPGDLAAWTMVASELEELAKRQPQVEPLIDRECAHGLNVARWATQRAILRRGEITLEKRCTLAQAMVPIIAEHRATWLERSRYGGLEDSCLHYKRHVWWY